MSHCQRQLFSIKRHIRTRNILKSSSSNSNSRDGKISLRSKYPDNTFTHIRSLNEHSVSSCTLSQSAHFFGCPIQTILVVLAVCRYRKANNLARNTEKSQIYTEKFAFHAVDSLFYTLVSRRVYDSVSECSSQCLSVYVHMHMRVCVLFQIVELNIESI